MPLLILSISSVLIAGYALWQSSTILKRAHAEGARYRRTLNLIAFGDQYALEKFAREQNGPNLPFPLSDSEVGDAMYSVRLLRYVAELSLAERPLRPGKPPPPLP